jgi:hypothetical protein
MIVVIGKSGLEKGANLAGFLFDNRCRIGMCTTIPAIHDCRTVAPAAREGPVYLWNWDQAANPVFAT